MTFLGNSFDLFNSIVYIAEHFRVFVCFHNTDGIDKSNNGLLNASIFLLSGNRLTVTGQKDERLATAPHRVHVIPQVITFIAT